MENNPDSLAVLAGLCNAHLGDEGIDGIRDATSQRIWLETRRFLTKSRVGLAGFRLTTANICVPRSPQPPPSIMDALWGRTSHL